jgi:hypothetical protein
VFGGEPSGPPHYRWHDHYVLPHVTHHEMSAAEQRQMLALKPSLKEVFQRYNLAYHTPSEESRESPLLLIGFHLTSVADDVGEHDGGQAMFVHGLLCELTGGSKRCV